jgi:hypothetical protein
VTAEDTRRLQALPDEALVVARQADNGRWYATVALDRRWPSDPDFSTCCTTAPEAVQRCAASIRADLRGEGKYAPHWTAYDVTYHLMTHWESRS